MVHDVGALGAGAGLVAYTYLGYPLLVGLAARVARRRAPAPASGTARPTVTVVIPAWNEAAVIAGKIDDTFALAYPPALLDVVVVADGSTDDTMRIARAKGVTVLWQPERRGKSAAVNRGVVVARGDVVCLTDANCSLDPEALSAVTAFFADPAVAVVGGAKVVTGDSAHGRGEGLYWRLESHVKRCESALGSTVGAPGELCSVRRSAFRPIPATVVNDDYHLTCDALVRGLAVRYAHRAVARETASPSLGEEFERRTRVAAGTWQTTLGHLRLCRPGRGWVALAFVSHRVLRSLVVPLLLPVLLLASGVLTRRSRFARLLFWGQATTYGAALLGVITDHPAVAAPFEFVFANAATVRGGWRHLTGRQPVAWRKARRSEWR